MPLPFFPVPSVSFIVVASLIFCFGVLILALLSLE